MEIHFYMVSNNGNSFELSAIAYPGKYKPSTNHKSINPDMVSEQ